MVLKATEDLKLGVVLVYVERSTFDTLLEIVDMVLEEV